MSENFGPKYSYQIEKNDIHFFDKIVYHKKHTWRWKNYMPVNSSKLKYYENKIYSMWWFTRWGCDYRTLSNYENKAISCAKCFDISNTTNSNFKRIDMSDINKTPNYKTAIVFEKVDIPKYNFDSITYDILPDNFSEVLISRNDTWKNFDE